MKVWETIRFLFLVLVILLNGLIGISTYYAVEKQKCQKKWESNYLVYSAIGISANALINMFIPFNKYMANFFLIGSIYALAVLLAIIGQIISLYRYNSTIQNCSKVSNNTKKVFGFTKHISIYGYIGISLGITFMLLYS